MLKKKSSLRHTGAFWAFVAPCCILFGIFFLLPLVLSIAFSFTNYDGWKVMDFVGIKNYITLFKDFVIKKEKHLSFYEKCFVFCLNPIISPNN